jgi:excisionase family DNA binding protein
MISFNSPSNSQQSNTAVLIHQYITVQAAADVTGYTIQYLRRMLRSGALKGIKIGYMWLIDMESLGKYLEHVEQTSDRCFGPK